MYGTVAQLKVKPGALEELIKSARRPRPGFIHTYVYQMDKDPNELMMVVIFKDKESYFANANSAEQDREYQALRKLLTADPNWHDGEIVFDFK